MSDELPKAWVIAALSEVIDDIQPGFASGEKNVHGGVPQLRMNNIGLDGNLVLDLIRTVPDKLAKPHHELKRGDVLVCTTNSGALVGKCALFDLSGRYVFSNHLTRLRPKLKLLNADFLRWNLWLLWRSGYFDDKCKHWVNQSALPKDALLESEVSIPPLAEQRRIVAKLEAVMGKLDGIRKRMDKIPVILKRFRQSVLAAACSGRLTADWRAIHSDEKVMEELLAFAAQEPDGGELPESWIRCRVGDVITLKNGYAFKSSDYASDGIPLVRISNIQAGRVVLDDCAKIPPIKANWNFAVEKDDLLVAMSGATTGKFGVCESANHCLQNQRVGNLRILNTKHVLPIFRNLVMQSLQRRIEEDAYGGAQPNISPSKIAALPFACPPLSEQHEIVRRVDALMKVADGLEARYTKAKAHVDKLTPALLAKAFRGELVPQDPNDEPASAILACNVANSRRDSHCRHSARRSNVSD